MYSDRMFFAVNRDIYYKYVRAKVVQITNKLCMYMPIYIITAITIMYYVHSISWALLICAGNTNS